MGRALVIEALVKFATKGTRHMLKSTPYLRNSEKLRGSAGSLDGCGTRRILS